MTSEIKSSAVSEVAMRLHDLGWPVVEYVEPTGGSGPRKVVISGKGRPTIISSDMTLVGALLASEREAKAWLSATTKPKGCECDDRSCEYCVKDSQSATLI